MDKEKGRTRRANRRGNKTIGMRGTKAGGNLGAGRVKNFGGLKQRQRKTALQSRNRSTTLKGGVIIEGVERYGGEVKGESDGVRGE